MLESSTTNALDRTGLDALALKPETCDVSSVATVAADLETITIDYEGRDHLPSRETLETLVRETTASVRVTTPVRADGFDPLGDDSRLADLPPGVGRVLVAGHPAYLTGAERRRAVAPRLGAALEDDPDAWVGTESVERIAMATGATQYDLLSRTTERELRGLRAAGFDGDVAIYAPTVRSPDPDVVLDAIGDYVARRQPVSRNLPTDATTDSSSTGRTREVLLEAADEYALVGSESAIRDRTDELRRAGATTIVGYPATGLDDLLE